MARLGQASLEMVSRFTVNRMVDRTLAVYKQFAGALIPQPESRLTAEMK